MNNEISSCSLCRNIPKKFKFSKVNKKFKVVCQCGRDANYHTSKEDAIEDWNNSNITPIDI